MALIWPPRRRHEECIHHVWLLMVVYDDKPKLTCIHTNIQTVHCIYCLQTFSIYLENLEYREHELLMATFTDRGTLCSLSKTRRCEQYVLGLHFPDGLPICCLSSGVLANRITLHERSEEPGMFFCLQKSQTQNCRERYSVRKCLSLSTVCPPVIFYPFAERITETAASSLPSSTELTAFHITITPV